MKASELIKELSELIDHYGDFEVLRGDEEPNRYPYDFAVTGVSYPVYRRWLYDCDTGPVMDGSGLAAYIKQGNFVGG